MARIWHRVAKKIVYYGQAVMFSHTVFSLTFAVLAMVAAAGGLPSLRTVLFILLALVAGRTGANAINRVIDRKYDEKNERTKDRHIPAGKIKPVELIVLTAVCYLVFVFAAYMLNPLCFYLSPVALALFTVYSYTKRFTFLCHIVLGVTCAGAPVGAWLAVTGAFSLLPFVLAAAVMLWIAGFDIIYATQDIAFDRENRLYSIPQTFGLKNSLLIAKACHAVMVLFLIAFGVLAGLSALYYGGLAIAAVLLLFEHRIIKPHNRKVMKLASYRLNQVVSVVICVFGCLAVFFGV